MYEWCSCTKRFLTARFNTSQRSGEVRFGKHSFTELISFNLQLHYNKIIWNWWYAKQYFCNYCCILLLYSTHIQHIILQNHVQYISKFISARDLNTSLNINIINEYVEFDILISPYLKGICQWPALGMLQNKNGFWHRERTTNNIRRKKNR